MSISSVSLCLDWCFSRVVSGISSVFFPILFTTPGNIFTLVTIHEMQMDRCCSLLLGVLVPAAALLVATRAARLCSVMVVLHLCPVIPAFDRRTSPDLRGSALASLACSDQLIDCPSRTRVPTTAA